MFTLIILAALVLAPMAALVVFGPGEASLSMDISKLYNIGVPDAELRSGPRSTHAPAIVQTVSERIPAGMTPVRDFALSSH
jgi:hypothetical protein